MFNHNGTPNNENIRPSISYAPAVAVGVFSDGLKAMWWGFGLNLAGFFPLIVFLAGLDNPRYMSTVGAWILVSPLLVAGVITGLWGIKNKGYQKDSIRYMGIGSVVMGLLFLLIPLAATLLYANGVGN